QEKLSERVGKKRSTIANYLRLLKLDPIIQTGMRDGFVSMGHGRALINIEDKKLQIKVYEKIITNSLSVRETENLVRNFQNGEPLVSEKPKEEAIPKHVKESINNLNTYLSAKVDVKMSKN